MKLVIWRRTIDEQDERSACAEPVLLGPHAVPPRPARAGRLDDGVIVAPSRAASGAIGAILVPVNLSGRVLRNRVPLRAGLHAARHGDELHIGEQLYWLASDLAPEEATYDPALHGEDLFCHLTKARLRAGDPIVLCPGTQHAPCGLIQSARAWHAAAAAGLACSACGFRADAEEWRPPRRAEDNRLAGLLRLAARKEAR